MQSRIGEDLRAAQVVNISNNVQSHSQMIFSRTAEPVAGIDTSISDNIISSLPEFKGVLLEMHQLLKDATEKSSLWAPVFIPIIN